MQMQYTYSIDTEQGLARVLVSGDVEFQGAVELIQTVSRDPRWQPGFSRLVDMRNARVLIPKAGSRDLATVNAAEGPGASSDKVPQHKVALITSDALSFGIASQYAAYSELAGVPTEVFQDLTSAEAWLGVTSSMQV
jgi:hypothetical protein